MDLHTVYSSRHLGTNILCFKLYTCVSLSQIACKRCWINSHTWYKLSKGLFCSCAAITGARAPEKPTQVPNHCPDYQPPRQKIVSAVLSLDLPIDFTFFIGKSDTFKHVKEAICGNSHCAQGYLQDVMQLAWVSQIKWEYLSLVCSVPKLPVRVIDFNCLISQP